MVINSNIIQNNPIVCISMLTYNHEKYIEQAIKSVIMQKTQYKYCLVIGEDASTDNTRKIVVEYAKKYPDKIIAILHDHNVGMVENVYAIRRFLVGKYIATLEGDDYWTDECKIEKQVSFLEKHPEYYAVAHNHYEVDETGRLIKGLKLIEYMSSYSRKKIYDLQELEKYYLPGHSSTLLYRNFLKELSSQQIEAYNKCKAIGDRKLSVILANMGLTYKMDEYMSAYRHCPNAWTQGNFVGGLAYNGYLNINLLKDMSYEMFGNKLCFHYGKMRSWYGTVINFIKKPRLTNFNAVIEILKDGDVLKKMCFLITHTFTYPLRRWR